MKVRLKYSKTGLLRFLSHLEVMRVLERAIRRAELPMAYSQGFNPRPRIVYGTASSVGLASETELVDLVLAEDIPILEVTKRLNAVLPSGIDLKSAILLPDRAKPAMAITQASEYRITGQGDAVKVMNGLETMVGKTGFIVARQKETRTKNIEVGSMLIEFFVKEMECGRMELILRLKDSPAGNLRPAEVLKALNAYFDAGLEVDEIIKTKVLTSTNGTMTPIL